MTDPYDYPLAVLVAHSKDHEHPGEPEAWGLTADDEDEDD